MNIQDLLWADGNDNTAGIQQAVYYAPLDDIATLPEPQVDVSNASGEFEQLVTISDNIIMKSGKVFRKMYVTLKNGSLKCETVGELDGKSYKNTLEFFHPGSKPQVLGFSQWAKNSSLIFLIPEADGQVRILGHKGYPAKLVNAPHDTGTKPEDTKGFKFSFESYRKGPAPVFTGQVQLQGSASGAVDANANSNQDIYFIDNS